MDKQLLRSLVLGSVPLNGTYEDISLLNGNGGNGNFSAIFRATHIPTRMPVALKFCIDQGNAYRRACFEREGHLLESKLRGDGAFVQLVDKPSTFTFSAQTPAGPFDVSIPFLPFEWMLHGDAAALIHEAPRDYLAFVRRIRLLRQMTYSVRRLHGHGCRHRDLKPDNFFLTRGKRVRLGDFGTTRVYDPTGSPILPVYGFPPGDLRYSAFEVIAGLDLNSDDWIRADIYSLGAIFFELLCGVEFTPVVFGDLHRIHEFMNHLKTVPEAKREHVYRAVVAGTDWRLESVRYYNNGIPKCTAPYLDELIPQMVRKDCERRRITLDRVDELLRKTELVARNELAQMRRRRGRSRGIK